MSPDSWTATTVPWLVAGWIVTVVVVAALIYLVMRAVLSKTEPQRLPEVLRALTPLLGGLTQALTRACSDPHGEDGIVLDPLIGQTKDSSTTPEGETS
jgi:hypothetical protein